MTPLRILSAVPVVGRVPDAAPRNWWTWSRHRVAPFSVTRAVSQASEASHCAEWESRLCAVPISLEKRKFAIFAARGDEEEGPHSSEIRMSLGHDAMSTANQQPEPVLPPFIVTVIAWKTKASAEVGHSMASLPVRVGVSHASVWSRAWITSWIAMDGSRSMNGALGGVSVTCPSCRVFGSVAASAFVTME